MQLPDGQSSIVRHPPLVLSAGKHRELMLTRTEILKRIGLDVVTAATCDELLQRLEGEHFDLVIICHTFKENERRRCTEAIRAQSPSTRILVLSLSEGERYPYADAVASTGPVPLFASGEQAIELAFRSRGR